MKNKYLKSKKLPLLLIVLFLINSFIISLQAQTHIDSVLQAIEDTAGTVRVGLVLAGGGAKGLAHIGVIKVLEEEGIHVEYVGGTSMGGLVGGLYALGNNSDDLEDIIYSMDWDKLLSDKVVRTDLPIDEKSDMSRYFLSLPLVGFVPNLPRGLKKGQLVQNEISKLCWPANDIHDFSKLPIPFYCIATDVETGEEVLLDRGSLPVALRSTMSIPSVFEPISLNGRMLVDGGLVNNLPVDVMRKKGMNFIIGIDVGADLYKKEEIKSIIEILDQASSFYGRIKLNQNIAITDIYIRPDISGLSTLDFNKTEEIIRRGEEAARAHIEEIRALARYLKKQNQIQPAPHKLKTDTNLYINKIKVFGSKKNTKKIVEARLLMKTPGHYSINQINSSVNRVYYSGFFEKITYSISRNDNGYTLNVNVEEKESNLFRAGGRYDDYTNASILMNIRLHNFLIDGSKTDLSFIMGLNPSASLSYVMDQGTKLGYGIKASYANREVFQYDLLFSRPSSSYFMSFSNFDLIAYTNYASNRRVIFGTQFDYFTLKSNVGIIPDFNLSAPIFNFYIEYLIDYYDDANYPTRGIKSDFKMNQSVAASKNSMFFVKADFETALSTLHNKIVFQPGLFIGASLGKTSDYPYGYIIGGQGQNYIRNMVPFVGMQYTSFLGDNAIIARTKVRWNFHGKHYLFVIGNMGTFNEIFEKMFVDSKLYYGGALGYSLNSLIGPIEFSIATSNQGPYSHSYLSIGYWF